MFIVYVLCMYLCMHTCTCASVYMSICIYVYIHTIFFLWSLSLYIRGSISVPRSFSLRAAAEVSFLNKIGGKMTHVGPGVVYFRVQVSRRRSLEPSNRPCLFQFGVEV